MSVAILKANVEKKTELPISTSNANPTSILPIHTNATNVPL